MNHVSLKDVCRITMGQSPASSSYNADGRGLPFFQGNADFGERHPRTRLWCDAPIKTAHAGDILVSVRAPIGAVNIARETCCIGRGLAAITPNSAKVFPLFAYWFLICQNAELNRHGTGSTFKAISKSILEKIELPAHPMAVQKRIASILEKLQTTLRLRRAQLAALDELVKARFLEIFGDPIANPKNWVTKSLLEIGTCKNGMNFHHDESGVEIHCLGVSDFKDRAIVENTTTLPKVSLNEMPPNDYLLQDGDIVFVRSNGNKALVGRTVAVYPGPVPTTFSGFCIRFRQSDSSVTTPYLLRVLKTDSMRQKMAGRGANIQNLNQQILSAMEIPIPPLDLQNQFAVLVAQVEKTKASVCASLSETQMLFDSLMQKYFG